MTKTNRIGTFTLGVIDDDGDPSCRRTAIVMHCDRCGAQLLNSYRSGARLPPSDSVERNAEHHLATCAGTTDERWFPAG